MLNGKFYTGLPAKMMDRHDGPNRQRTNFFWPDESDMESANETRSRMRNNRRVEQTPEKTINIEVNPNELHKKEMSSKINLNDNLPVAEKTRVTSTPMTNTLKPAVAKSTNIQRRDTFSSRIQFYDFDNESQTPARRRTEKNSNIDVENNSKNSTKTSDKRISFTENKLRDMSPSAGSQGILKNNKTSPAAKPTPATPPIKNLCKSKSMSDVSAQKNVKIIANNMKNISLSREQNHHDYDDHDDYMPPPRRQIRSQVRPGPQPPQRRTRPVTEYFDDADDDYYYTPRRRSPGFIKPLPHHRMYNPYDEDHDFEDVYRTPRINTSQQYYTHRVERRMASRGAPDYDDDYDYHHRFERSRRSETSKRALPKEYNHRPQIDHDHDYEPVVNGTQETRSVSPPPATTTGASANLDRNIDEGQKPNNLIRNTQTPPNNSRVQSSRTQRHLVSNVAFWSDAETSNSPSRSIRNSAVTRVSVGLPDA